MHHDHCEIAVRSLFASPRFLVGLTPYSTVQVVYSEAIQVGHLNPMTETKSNIKGLIYPVYIYSIDMYVFTQA